MINSFTISYWLLSLLSLAMSVPAALICLHLGRQTGRRTAAVPLTAEPMVYLVIALIGIAFVIRLFLTPIWFLALHSLIPLIPGAMCLAGVHLAIPRPVHRQRDEGRGSICLRILVAAQLAGPAIPNAAIHETQTTAPARDRASSRSRMRA